MRLPLQPAPGTDPIQWSAIIANDLDWKILAGLILALSALLSYGTNRVFKRWNKAGWISGRTRFFLEVITYVAIPAFGAFAGWLIWHWGTGLMFALVGAWSSPWMMKRLNKLVGSYEKKRDDAE